MKYFHLFLLTLIFGCKHSQKTVLNTLPEVKITGNKNTGLEVLRATKEFSFDLIHTSLELTPVWETEQMNSTAKLILKPYFYSTDKLILDAKKMDIHSLSVKNKNVEIKIKYEYDSSKLEIWLDKMYSAEDTLEVSIKYTANPKLIASGGSRAIRQDKGLYFINADEKNKEVPRHLWTQGETQANSCWFPTIDQPNEKHTQDIRITIENDFTSLSNGLKTQTIQHNNGTKTEVWTQSLPHSVYLTVLVVGKFEVIKDTWKNKEVSYYMEPKFAAMAKPIFGRTPEMIEFFSNLLGVYYPWDKYSQVIIHDFVAGAMENTSAVTFHNFVQKDSRELLDQNDDETIAHELFHHWFGDMVTCESWSHLPLNESFANYSEYLWFEHKYGRAAADVIGYKDLDDYLKQSSSKVQPLIRFDYKSQEDMFDVLSYNKGGRILHQLRKQIGDKAFFLGLQLYLNKYAFKTAEVSNLRQCFEEITGKDLNRYFNQWFFTGGHPIVTVQHERNERGILITTKQNHSIDDGYIYDIPLQVDFYFDTNIVRKTIVLNHINDTFLFVFDNPILFANIDADKSFVGEIMEIKTKEEFITQFRKGPLYLDKLDALKFLKTYKADVDVQKAVTWGLNSDLPLIAVECVKLLKVTSGDSGKLDKLYWLAQYHKKGIVRAAAIEKLSEIKQIETSSLFIKALKDSSYLVEAEALNALRKVNVEQGKVEAIKRMDGDNFTVKQAVLNVLSLHGDSVYYDYFIAQIKKGRDFKKAYIMGYFGTYFSTQPRTVFNNAIEYIQAYRTEYKGHWYGKSGFQGAVNNAIKALKHNMDEESKKRIAILNSIL